MCWRIPTCAAEVCLTQEAQLPIAVVGGGPAGALAASLLAAGGKNVVLFDEKLAWEKPCGGGVTHKALQQYPFIRDAQSDYRAVEDCEMLSPSGRRARFQLRNPVAIFSRLVLNDRLLERARGAGAELRKERVTRIDGAPGDWSLTTPQGEYRASYVVLAAGARNSLRGQFAPNFSPEDLLVTAGYFIPGRTSLLQIQFLKEMPGYIWIFPRADHVSAGIAGKMGAASTSALRQMLEQWLGEHGFKVEGAQFYSHILPALRPESIENLRVSGEGWALIGDSAGLVDPITGEGLYYALRSAELCAGSVLAGETARYPTELQNEILPELKLAARISDRFYGGKFYGKSILERMVALTQHSATCRDLMCDLVAGTQGYCDLKSRVYRSLPAMMMEVLASRVRLGWDGDAASRVSTRSS